MSHHQNTLFYMHVHKSWCIFVEIHLTETPPFRPQDLKDFWEG